MLVPALRMQSQDVRQRERCEKGRQGKRLYVGACHLKVHERLGMLRAEVGERELDHLRTDGSASKAERHDACCEKEQRSCESTIAAHIQNLEKVSDIAKK